MNIHYISLQNQWEAEKKDLMPIIEKALSTGHYVNTTAEITEEFEKKIAALCNTKYAFTLNSGTDALFFALYLLNVRRGDEVITVPNSFIATTAVIVHLGAKPIFVDVGQDQNMDTNLLEKAITKKQKQCYRFI